MKISFTTGRVGGSPSYVPAHNDGAKDVMQRLNFSVAIHDWRKKEGADFVDMTIWGPYADTMARMVCPGSFVIMIGRDKPYESRLVDPITNHYIVNSQGVPAVTKKAQSTTIMELEVIQGTESARRLAEEVKNYIDGKHQDIFAIRPPGWHQENTQAAAIWARIKEDRNKAKFQPGSQIFGFAKVQDLKPGSRIIHFEEPAQQIAAFTSPYTPEPQSQKPVYPNTPPVYPIPAVTNQNNIPHWNQKQPMQQFANQQQPQQPQPNQQQYAQVDW